jgi:hypothetical protein
MTDGGTIIEPSESSDGLAGAGTDEPAAMTSASEIELEAGADAGNAAEAETDAGCEGCL